jgi:hypothetical protein
MRLLAVVTLCSLVAAGTVGAQAVVSPGMSRAQVIAVLGKPSAERAADSSVFLFYPNGMERRVGMSDLVVLTADKVVDAVFRAKTRRYAGTSSSPAPIPADVARKQRPTPGGELQLSPPPTPPKKP